MLRLLAVLHAHGIQADHHAASPALLSGRDAPGPLSATPCLSPLPAAPDTPSPQLAAIHRHRLCGVSSGCSSSNGATSPPRAPSTQRPCEGSAGVGPAEDEAQLQAVCPRAHSLVDVSPTLAR